MPVQVQKLHVDVAVQGVTVDFCGHSQVRACRVAAPAVCLACVLSACQTPYYIGSCTAWHSAHDAIHAECLGPVKIITVTPTTGTATDHTHLAPVLECVTNYYYYQLTMTTMTIIHHGTRSPCTPCAPHPRWYDDAVSCPCSRSLRPSRLNFTAP